MISPDEQLARALRAVRLLRAQTEQDRDGIAEAMEPEVEATLGMQLLREFASPPDIASINAYLSDLGRAYEAARDLYLGMDDVMLAALTVISRGDPAVVLSFLDEVEDALRQSIRGRPE